MSAQDGPVVPDWDPYRSIEEIEMMARATAEAAPRFIGLDLATASARAAQLAFRLVWTDLDALEDGAHVFQTDDFDPHRVTVGLRGGVVISAVGDWRQ